jgi:hypothetical protein
MTRKGIAIKSNLSELVQSAMSFIPRAGLAQSTDRRWSVLAGALPRWLLRGQAAVPATSIEMGCVVRQLHGISGPVLPACGRGTMVAIRFPWELGKAVSQCAKARDRWAAGAPPPVISGLAPLEGDCQRARLRTRIGTEDLHCGRHLLDGLDRCIELACRERRCQPDRRLSASRWDCFRRGKRGTIRGSLPR